jgi:hypothetical protein
VWSFPTGVRLFQDEPCGALAVLMMPPVANAVGANPGGCCTSHLYSSAEDWYQSYAITTFENVVLFAVAVGSVNCEYGCWLVVLVT